MQTESAILSTLLGGKKKKTQQLRIILLITCKYIRSATSSMCSIQNQAIKFFIRNTLNVTISHGNESRLGKQPQRIHTENNNKKRN